MSFLALILNKFMCLWFLYFLVFCSFLLSCSKFIKYHRKIVHSQKLVVNLSAWPLLTASYSRIKSVFCFFFHWKIIRNHRWPWHVIIKTCTFNILSALPLFLPKLHLHTGQSLLDKVKVCVKPKTILTMIKYIKSLFLLHPSLLIPPPPPPLSLKVELCNKPSS